MKNTSERLNEKLTTLGLPVINVIDEHPERTAYLAHVSEPHWDNDVWVAKWKKLKNDYKLTFHRHVAKVYPNLLYEIGEDRIYWNYNEKTGVYDELVFSTVRGMIVKLLVEEGLDESATEQFAKACLVRYRALYQERARRYDDFDSDDNLFHADNGWVNLTTNEFTPHTPHLESRRKSKVPYQLGATCPSYDSFLDSDLQLAHDQVRVIDQFSGLCLTGDIRHQKMLTLIGRPGSGKSTLLESWSYVLGDLAIQRKLTELQGDAHRFAGASFLGSTLCWFDEVDVKKAEMGNTLGTLITGESINVERKGVTGILRARNTMKCVLTANRLPNTAELGIYRRLILIEIKHSFTDDNTEKVDMLDVLKGEAPGILNRMIRGLNDLKKMRGFTVISGHDDLIEEYKAQSDTVAEFLDTYFVPGGEEDTVTSKQLIDAYKVFTNDRTFMILTPQKFGRLLASQPLTRFSKIHRSIERSGGDVYRVWCGLKLKDGFHFESYTNSIVEKETF